MATAKSIKLVLGKAAKAAYGQPPAPWQAEAIVAATLQHEQREMLFNHPRGSGKTREIAMMTYIAMRFNKVRLAFLITDRTDLEEVLAGEVSTFLEKIGYAAGVERCACSRDVEQAIERLESDPNAQSVLSITLQTFPHIKTALSRELREGAMALADEVHRSHADKSLSEELNRVLGGAVPLRLYTGTATDRCLRLFGNRVQQGGVEVHRPFHSASEADVAKHGMIFEMSKFKFEYLEPELDTSNIFEAAQDQGLDASLLDAIYDQGQKTSVVVRHKAKILVQRLRSLREQTHGFTPLMMVVTESRQSVLDYTQAFKSLVGDLSVYGAFSGQLEHGGVCVDEPKYNASLFEQFDSMPHRHADILVACDRFETGYDNNAICIVGVDRRIGSAEKLVQVYSRANRQRPGKHFPLVVDFQNAPQDVERAILDFSVTRECLASTDQIETLSNSLREALGDLLQVEDPTLLTDAVELKTAAERQLLSQLLPSYLRCREKGVDRQTRECNLVPHSKALAVWGCLQQHHRGDVTAVKERARDIAEKNTILRGFSVLDLDFEPFQFDDEAAPSCSTPEKPRTSPLGEPDDEDAPMTAEKEARLDALSRLQDALPNNASNTDDVNVGPSWKADQLEKDLKILQKWQKGLRRNGFEALRRVVSAAGDAAGRRRLMQLGVVDVLLNRLSCGDQVEKSFVMRGICQLTTISERASKVFSAARNVEHLRKCESLRKDVEVQAMRDLVALLKKEKKATEEKAKLELKLEATKNLVLSVKEDERLKKEAGPQVQNLMFLDPMFMWTWNKSRTQINLEERQMRARAKEQHKRVLEELAAKVDALNSKVKQLSSNVEEFEADLELILALGVEPAAYHVTNVCGKVKIGAAQARGPLMQLFELLPVRAEVAALVADIKSIKRAKASATGGLVGEISDRFAARTDNVLRIGLGLGVVDDLVAIATGPKATPVAIEILLSYGTLDNKAKKLCADWQDALDRARTEISPDDSEEQVVEMALKSLRKEPKKKRKLESFEKPAEETMMG